VGRDWPSQISPNSNRLCQKWALRLYKWNYGEVEFWGRKKGVFVCFFGSKIVGSREEGFYNSVKSAKNGVFPRLQGVFSIGESIGGGFEACKKFLGGNSGVFEKDPAATIYY
jgi:hypothetical protein